MEILDYIKLAGWSAGSVAAIFAATHAVSTDKFNRELTSQLQNLDLIQWFREVTERSSMLFDYMFGSRVLSIRFILSACTASVFAIMIVFGIFVNIAGISVAYYFSTWPNEIIFWGVTTLIFANIFPDTISLLETRFLLRTTRNSRSIGILSIVLIIDFAATISIWTVFYPIVPWFNRSMLSGSFSASELWPLYSVEILIPFVWNLLTNLTIDPIASQKFETPIQFYTTFLTSIWIWFFALSAVFAKVGAKLFAPAWLWLATHLLDIESKPILALGWISSGIVLAVFAIAAPIIA